MPVKFQSWKHKEPAWKQNESRAKALDRITLYCRVLKVDLFAIAANYHPCCPNTEYFNHMRGLERIQKQDARKTAAHNKAYADAKGCVKTHVIENN